MGFLERAIRRGVSDAVGKAVGTAIKEAVEPKATELANKAAASIEQQAAAVNNAANQSAQSAQTAAAATAQTAQTSQLGGAFASLAKSMEGFAEQAAKSMKVCPACGEAASADQKFCPSCGAKLPETTVAEGAVCTACGKQNKIGTKFCQDCGAKLPSAVAEEQAAADKNAAVLARWATDLAPYPVWNLGGNDYKISIEDGYSYFQCTFNTEFAAINAVEQYRKVLRDNGFREAGMYPDKTALYKKVDGVCYHVDTGNCFNGGSDCPQIFFNIDEPEGGFDYVKPEPKKQSGLFGGLFG